jgi:hypothetical protein
MTRAEGQIGHLTAIWDSRLRSRLRNALLYILLPSLSLVLVSCFQGPRLTEDPQSSVVKLRYELIAFAKGELNEVTGRTEPEEAYILMYGYQEPLDSLSISGTLQEKLKAIRPRPTEMYVLAHVHGDDIKEYTEWERHNENYHAGLWPMPFMIRGDHFKITARERERHSIVMKIE